MSNANLNIWHHLSDAQLSAEDHISVESSVPVENVFIDKEAVYKLTEGLLSHYLPGLQNSKRTLQELTWVDWWPQIIDLFFIEYSGIF